VNRERHLAFLAYQLGFASVSFPAQAGHYWRTADVVDGVMDAVPPVPRLHFQELLDATQRLRPLAPDRGEELAGQVTESAQRAWQLFERAWGGKTHRKRIARREGTEPEFFDWEEVEAGSPFAEPVWDELRQTVETFRTALPPAAAAWVRLGAAVAEVFDPRAGGAYMLAAIAPLQNQLSEMLPEPLLAGLPLDLSRASPEQISDLDASIRKRLTEASLKGDNPCESATSARVTEGLNEDELPPGKLSKEEQALAVLIANPTISDTEIAERVGCNRTSLYRMHRLMSARAWLKQGKAETRRGRQDRDRAGAPFVDGDDESDPSDEFDD
jgi:hypothetical protein